MTEAARDTDKVAPFPETATKPAPRGGRRAKLFMGLAGVVALGGLAYGGWWLLVGSQQVTTDNAYVSAESALVTPAVGGTVREVRVVDTQTVRQGDVLAVIDDTDAQLALAQAEAAYGQAVRRVQGFYANDEALSAQVAARAADVTRVLAQTAAARADLERANVDVERRRALAASGSVSAEEVSHAENALTTARQALNAAQAAEAQARASRAAAVGQADANAVLTRGATVQTNPEVAAAKARLDQAKVDLERTIVRAPVAGVVAKRQVQIGQRIAPGAPLMAVVPIQQAYVEANFKEVQLKDVKIGQPVELESDLYGSSVKYHGKVAGLAGGTGAAFAIVPAQNATGNWIKVVQRVPVRVSLDPKELEAHPLRLGLSMTAVIHTGR